MSRVDIHVTHAQLCAAPNLLDAKADVTARKSDFPEHGGGVWSALRVRVDCKLLPLLDPAPRVAFALATSYLRIQLDKLDKRTVLIDEDIRYVIGPWRRLPGQVAFRYEDMVVQILLAETIPMFGGAMRLCFEAA